MIVLKRLKELMMYAYCNCRSQFLKKTNPSTYLTFCLQLLEYGKSEDAILPYDEVAVLVEGGEIESATLVDMIQTQLINRKTEKERVEAEEKKKEEKRAKKPKLRDIVPTPAPAGDDEEDLWGEDGKKIEKQPLVCGTGLDLYQSIKSIGYRYCAIVVCN